MLRICPHCGSNQVDASRRRRLFDWLFLIFGRKPFRCMICSTRFFTALAETLETAFLRGRLHRGGPDFDILILKRTHCRRNRKSILSGRRWRQSRQNRRGRPSGRKIGHAQDRRERSRCRARLRRYAVNADYTIVADGNAESMVRQGVTSMILGEGGSAAPVGGKRGAHSQSLLIGPISRSYFSTLLKQGISANIGTYVGSSQIWTYVRGEKAGPPTPEEVKEMQAQVEIAMKQGALGVAGSLSGPPGSWIDTDTLVAMCQIASRNGGIYSTHMRTEAARRLRVGGGGDRDRQARSCAGGHYPSQDRRARNVGTDARAGVDDRGSAGARPGSANQRLPVSRRPE